MVRREQVHNELSQDEKRDVVESDRRARARERNASSYHQFATSEADPVHDRFEEINRSSVTGATQRYPEQPETSFYHHDPVGAEPPVEYDLNEMVAVGEPFEIEKSEIKKSLRETSGGEGVIQTAPSNGSPKSGRPGSRRWPACPLTLTPSSGLGAN
jgi:hypothetical protein